jgi:hypothetical protein
VKLAGQRPGGVKLAAGGPAAGGMKFAAGRPSGLTAKHFNVAEMLFKQLNGI